MLNALQENLGYKVGAVLKTTHTYTPGKLKEFALQSLIISKSKITKLSKTSIEKGMLFYQEIPRFTKRTRYSINWTNRSNNFFYRSPAQYPAKQHPCLG